VRPPAPNFAAGIWSEIGGGNPDFAIALAQHGRYCETLRECGLNVTQLAADFEHPDSTFIEDTAVLTNRAAIITRPGAQARAAEATATLKSMRAFFDTVHEIQAPGTVDGGDVCAVDGEFIIGLSARTNDEGVKQLRALLARLGHKSSIVDIRASKTLLHLKSGLSYLGDGVFVIASEAPLENALRRYKVITVSPTEAYAANCIRLNDNVVIAADYPELFGALTARGYQVVALAMSEFRRMDGGLSCLSLRF
jgi:dimethylargininase